MDFDHELLLSVASGLGRWSDGPDGAPVYTKDDDCVGAWGGGGGAGTDAVGKNRERASAAPLSKRRAARLCPAGRGGGGCRLWPRPGRGDGLTRSHATRTREEGKQWTQAGRRAAARAHPTQLKEEGGHAPPPPPRLSLTPLSPPLSSSLPQRLATLPPPGRPRHPPRLHPPGPLQPGQVGPGPTDDPVCGRRGHRHPRPCVFFGFWCFFCLHFFHARPALLPSFHPVRAHAFLVPPSLPSLFPQSRSPPS